MSPPRPHVPLATTLLRCWPSKDSDTLRWIPFLSWTVTFPHWGRDTVLWFIAAAQEYARAESNQPETSWLPFSKSWAHQAGRKKQGNMVRGFSVKKRCPQDGENSRALAPPTETAGSREEARGSGQRHGGSQPAHSPRPHGLTAWSAEGQTAVRPFPFPGNGTNPKMTKMGLPQPGGRRT